MLFYWSKINIIESLKYKVSSYFRYLFQDYSMDYGGNIDCIRQPKSSRKQCWKGNQTLSGRSRCILNWDFVMEIDLIVTVTDRKESHVACATVYSIYIWIKALYVFSIIHDFIRIPYIQMTLILDCWYSWKGFLMIADLVFPPKPEI